MLIVYIVDNPAFLGYFLNFEIKILNFEKYQAICNLCIKANFRLLKGVPIAKRKQVLSPFQKYISYNFWSESIKLVILINLQSDLKL
jgi:hypothetical protein